MLSDHGSVGQAHLEEASAVDVISAILDIENTAKEMMENAQKQREEILAQARENEQSIKDDISAEVSRALEQFEEQQKQEAEQEMQDIRAQTQVAMNRLDDTFERDHEKWEAQIFGSIIGDK